MIITRTNVGTEADRSSAANQNLVKKYACGVRTHKVPEVEQKEQLVEREAKHTDAGGTKEQELDASSI
jgi:hypothetical protein